MAISMSKNEIEKMEASGYAMTANESRQMTQFNEGQEVEVRHELADGKWAASYGWSKAKIMAGTELSSTEKFVVEFADGTRAVFDADHIRAVEKPTRDDNGRSVRGF